MDMIDQIILSQMDMSHVWAFFKRNIEQAKSFQAQANDMDNKEVDETPIEERASVIEACNQSTIDVGKVRDLADEFISELKNLKVAIQNRFGESK